MSAASEVFDLEDAPEVTSSGAKGRPAGDYQEHCRDFSELDPKTKRKSCKCANCPHEYISMRPEHIYKHITGGCKAATKEIKQRCVDQFADKQSLVVPATRKTRFGPKSAASLGKADSANSGSSIKQFASSTDRCPPQAHASLDTKAVRAGMLSMQASPSMLLTTPSSKIGSTR